MSEETMMLPLAVDGKVWIPENSEVRKHRMYTQVCAEMARVGKDLRKQILLFCLPAIPLMIFGLVAILISKWAFLFIACGLLLGGAVMGLRLYFPIIKRYYALQKQVKAWR